MNKNQRIILFSILLVMLLVIFELIRGSWIPSGDINIVLFSALILLSFNVLFLEHFFTKPSDVLASTVSILLLISPLSKDLSNLGIWYYIFWWYNFALLLMSFISLLLLDIDKSILSWRNKCSDVLKTICTHFGNGKILYFTLFLLTLLFYVDTQSKHFIILFGYATVILLINPNKMVIKILRKPKFKNQAIGELFGVQSKNVFLAKMYKDVYEIKKFDIVAFGSTIMESKKVHAGLVIDKYLLDKEQWLKILCDIPMADKQLAEDIPQKGNFSNNILFRIKTNRDLAFIDKLVGVVIENSTIDKIRFEYIGKAKVSEGDLLEVIIDDAKVIYQIVQGVTNIEQLESKNESGIIIGEAVQLGTWDSKRKSFEKFGWVPDINSSVWIASDIKDLKLGEDERQIGTVPNTNYPVLINVEEAIKHHLAILGITGTGKSVFARKLIEQICEYETKVICVDFTQEYKTKIKDLKTIVSYEKSGNDTKSQAEKIFEHIDWISNELEKFGNQQSKEGLRTRRSQIFAEFQNAIELFMESDKKLGLFELPDVSNTTGILEYTRWFFHTIFYMAKNSELNKKLCIVIEEAHTVVPEWNFIGERDKHAGSLVNAISQIALQGRKYNVGFIIIAQRTANVSKTVLTQCNSVVAFQQFDKTSTEFLANYMGTTMANTLPNLKFRQAIAVGRGFCSGVPVIFEVPEIKEED
jgi:hypothetical protein